MRFAVAFLLASPAMAQTLPAPDYFVATAFETSTAQALARSCATLSVDPVAAARRSETVLAALMADGFDPATLPEQMADPSEAIAARQAAFLARHDLADGASEAAVCAAGRQEIAAGTDLGALLTEVAP